MMATQTSEERPRRRAAKRAPAALEQALPRSIPPKGVFATWCELQRDSGNMNQKSLDKYASLWKGWRAWLVRNRIRLRDLTAQELKGFLEGPAPSLNPRHRPLNGSCMSPNTQARYYHLIDSVFSLCLYPSDAAANPCRLLEPNSRPTLTEDKLKPKKLDTTVFDALRDVRHIRATIPIANNQNNRWWLLRDRAILAVLADTGLTASELCELTPRQLGGEGLKVSPAQLQLDGMGGEVRIQLENPYTNIGRNLPMTTGKSRLMLEWLHRRTQLLKESAARLPTAAQRAAYLAQHQNDAPVFLAKPRNNNDLVFKPMRPDSLYYVVHAALGELRRRVGVAPESDARADGPAVIRNSLIQYWVNLHGAKLAAELAGYADEASLRVSRQTQGKA